MSKIKSGEEYISTIDKYKTIALYLWRIIIVQTIVIIVLIIGYFELKETARVQVELPSKLLYKYAPVVVAGISGANEIYYKLWGNYIINKIANIDYENANITMDILAKMMRPEDYVKEKKKIDTLANHIKDNLIKQKFTITDTKLNILSKKEDLIKTAIVTVKGDATQLIGKNKIKRHCSYKIKLDYLKGVIYVKNFTTDCF